MPTLQAAGSIIIWLTVWSTIWQSHNYSWQSHVLHDLAWLPITWQCPDQEPYWSNFILESTGEHQLVFELELNVMQALVLEPYLSACHALGEIPGKVIPGICFMGTVPQIMPICRLHRPSMITVSLLLLWEMVTLQYTGRVCPHAYNLWICICQQHFFCSTGLPRMTRINTPNDTCLGVVGYDCVWAAVH